MNSAVNYIIESGVSLSVLTVIYVGFLRKETFFKTNRLFLLSSLIFSVVLPLLKFRIFSPRPLMLAEVTVTPYRNVIEVVTVYSQEFSGSIEQAILSTRMILFFYLAGVVFFFGRFLFRIMQLMLVIRKNKVEKIKDFKLVTLEEEISPYSFLDFVFVSRALQQTEGYDRMIAHELEHVKQGHSVDVLILELLTIFQWFNPFMWMLRRSVRENHEYLADRAVIVSGVTLGYYKKLLLNQFVGGQLVIANNFNYSLIKKRIKMMSKIKSSKLAITKIVFGVVMAAALIVAFACEQKESIEIQPFTENATVKLTIQGEKLKIDGTMEDVTKLKNLFDGNSGFEVLTDSVGNIFLSKKEAKLPESLNAEEQIFFIVEEMPEYPGGELALRKHIGSSVEYPVAAQDKGIQGKVYVTFVVSKDGTVVNAKIVRGVDPSLDAEALRVVNGLPKWQPGKQKGKAVNVSYTVPINFALQ